MALERYNFNIGGYFKVLKLARTIADIEGNMHIKSFHIQEAIGYYSPIYDW